MHYSQLLSLGAVASIAAASPLNLFCGRSDVVGPTCSKQEVSQLSCRNTTNPENLCCFNSPGGQILLTQFWNAQPDIGPVDSWTLHGLWPDNCDGTWEQFCDKSRESTDISAVMNKFGRTETLSYMQKYWRSNNNNDDGLWQHEWNKHGTCMSTYNPECYSTPQKDQAIADYMDKSVELFKQLDTYKTLAAAGIVPSTSETYTLSALQAAAKAAHGEEVVFNCKGGKLVEVWYHFNVYGSAQSGKYVPSLVVGSPSNCPKTGIMYLPKNGNGNGGGNGSKPSSTRSPPVPQPTGNPGEPFSGRGYLTVDKGGCLISSGKWYTKGTCATFTAAAAGSGFTLRSSKGPCGVVSGELQCGAEVEATTFTATESKLANGYTTAFYASGDANTGSQVAVFTTSEGKPTTLSISWLGL
ncbi:hypothetical protein DRE_07367 [Drechslerella stenobrocha 248]|uniref:Ribonuclease T2-like n=1 Tax=Drechslerella stenobrocha 248 TaxID=1043628 RepID=W7HL41_9PEZI|nr:hypothetical protein DRE_07367 [Drechslerella stenobrocha 248]